MFTRKDINFYISQAKDSKDIYLIDVRTPDEYRSGHIPGSINVSYDNIFEINKILPSFNVKKFTYCETGFRSSLAASKLRSMGYRDVSNIGGIASYTGEREK